MNLIRKVSTRATFPLLLALAGCSSEDSTEGRATEPRLLLDYTAFVEGAVQVSGIAVDRKNALAVLCTDHERAIVFELETLDAVAEFSVQFGDLPEQGASEAIGVTESGDVVVLYPDHETLVTFDLQGEHLGEVNLPSGDWFGAMALEPASEIAYLVRKEGKDYELVGFDLEEDESTATVKLEGELVGTQLEGLSLDLDGTATRLWAVSKPNQVFLIEPGSGKTTKMGDALEVGEGSAIEAFTNLVEGVPEDVFAISDDDNSYNTEPGPLRLYLLDN